MDNETDFVERMFYALRAPILAWPGCESTITDEQCVNAKLHRLAMMATAQKLEESTNFEAMLYVMTSTFANPPSHTWYKIYMFLFREFYREQSVVMFGDEIEKVEEYEMRELTGLKRWIFKQQMQVLKDRRKTEKQKVVVPQEKFEQLTLPLSK